MSYWTDRNYSAVIKAKRHGLLDKQPCEVCGKKKTVVGHHDDYAKPLQIIWLCQKHHIARHKALGWGFGWWRKGSGRPSEKCISKTIVIPTELHSLLWLEAAKRGMKLHTFVVAALWRVVGRKQK